MLTPAHSVHTQADSHTVYSSPNNHVCMHLYANDSTTMMVVTWLIRSEPQNLLSSKYAHLFDRMINCVCGHFGGEQRYAKCICRIDRARNGLVVNTELFFSHTFFVHNIDTNSQSEHLEGNGLHLSNKNTYYSHTHSVTMSMSRSLLCYSHVWRFGRIASWNWHRIVNKHRTTHRVGCVSMC